MARLYKNLDLFDLPNISAFFWCDVHLVLRHDFESLIEVRHGAEGAVDTGFGR